MAENSEERRPGPQARSSGSGPDRPRRDRRRPMRRRRKRCAFCADRKISIDYKSAGQLQSYVTDRGKILPRRATGLCARHQRQIALAVKRARHLALLPFVVERQRSS